MTHQSSVEVRLLTTILFLICCLGSQAQEDAPEKPDEFAKQRRAVKRVNARIDGNELELLPGPLYTYDEALHKWNDGTSWIWGSEGRPDILLNMVTQRTTRYYEFISLTNAEVEVETPTGTNWKPETNWNPTKIEKAPKPSKKKAERLKQMLAIAKRLSGTQSFKGAQDKLQLVPQPIYRYFGESEESLDGAIFAFLRRHDLETVAVIEAAKQKDGTAEWVIDCMPASIAKQEVRLDDKVVWFKPEMTYPEVMEQDAPYHIVQGRAELPKEEKEKFIWRWLDASIAGRQRVVKLQKRPADRLLSNEQLNLMRSIKETKDVSVAKQYMLVHTLMTLTQAKRSLSLLDNPKDARRPGVQRQIMMTRGLLDSLGYDQHYEAEENDIDNQ